MLAQGLVKAVFAVVARPMLKHSFAAFKIFLIINAEEAGAAHDYNDEAEEDEGMGLRQSSGLSQLPEYGGDDAEGNRSRRRRAMKGPGRAAGKGNRRRRLDEEDEQAEELRVNRKRKRGESTCCLYHIASPAQNVFLHVSCFLLLESHQGCQTLQHPHANLQRGQ